MLEKVIFPINTPVELALRFDTGKPVTSKFDGDQMLYTVIEGGSEKVAYLPLTVAARFAELGIKADEGIAVTKGVRAQGSQRVQFWTVTRIAPPPTPKQTPPPLPPATQELARVGQPVTVTPDTQAAYAVRTAIKAIMDGEAYAKEIGYDCRFTAEQVKSYAITILIGMQQGGGR